MADSMKSDAMQVEYVDMRMNVLVYCVFVSEETQCKGGVCNGPDA